MAQNLENKNTLKKLPFYSEETKSVKKRIKKLVILVFYLNYHFFLKNVKNSVNINSQKNCHSFQKDQKN